MTSEGRRLAPLPGERPDSVESDTCPSGSSFIYKFIRSFSTPRSAFICGD